LSVWSRAGPSPLRPAPGAHRNGDRSGKRAAGWSPFKWVKTTLGNVKAAVTGICSSISAEHADRYLANFACRYNRRFQLTTLIPRLVHSAVRTTPLPYRQLVVS
jgi:hypothetical protein